MDTLDMLARLLPGEAGKAIADRRDALTEVRLRVGSDVQLRWHSGDMFAGESLTAETLNRILAALMDYSLYAREWELAQGYFTLSDGCRVGVCGRVAMGDTPRMAHIRSACVRVCRQIHDDEGLCDIITEGGSVRSTLIISRPGGGKTTLLRAVIRGLSMAGWCVAVSDERGELAACAGGGPSMDLGPRTDVMDGLPRWEAIPALIRSMSPQVVAADEIGSPEDARALAEAARCGVTVLATAHAVSLEEARQRRELLECLASGVFALAVLLDGAPGQIAQVVRLNEGGEVMAGDAVSVGDLRRDRMCHGRQGSFGGFAPQGAAAG